mgnify:CR=1 FL=1
MFDTIKFNIPYSDDLFDDFRKGGNILKSSDSVGFTQEFKVYEAIEIPPYQRTVQLYSREIPFGKRGLYLEFSIPKLLHGTNVYLANIFELETLFEKIYQIIKSKYKLFPPTKLWTVQRLDICYFWKFTSPEIAQRHLDFIKFIEYPRKNRHFYKTTAMFSGRNFTLRFYIKKPEYLMSDYKVLKYDFEDEAQKGLDYCQNMIRFEVEIRKPELFRIFKKDVQIPDLLNEDFYIKKLQYYLSTYNFPKKINPSLKKFEIFQNVFSVPTNTIELSRGRQPRTQAVM